VALSFTSILELDQLNRSLGQAQKLNLKLRDRSHPTAQLYTMHHD
jgi:hypothetical protein